MRPLLIVLFVITLIDLAPPARAQIGVSIVYVNAEAEAEGSGQSWNSPYRDLQEALAFARDHSVDQIWVAAGPYYTTTQFDVRAAFELVDGVDLYGGFIGNETHLEQRDPEVNVTTLSGFLDEDNSIRSIHVVVADEATAGRDGFVVTGGCACGTPEGSYNQIEDLRGGGLRASHSQISLSAMTFTANRAGDARGGDFGPMTGSGGAVYFHDGSLSVINSIFDSNTASTSQGGRGGALMGVDGRRWASMGIWKSLIRNLRIILSEAPRS